MEYRRLGTEDGARPQRMTPMARTEDTVADVVTELISHHDVQMASQLTSMHEDAEQTISPDSLDIGCEAPALSAVERSALMSQLTRSEHDQPKSLKSSTKPQREPNIKRKTTCDADSGIQSQGPVIINNPSSLSQRPVCQTEDADAKKESCRPSRDSKPNINISEDQCSGEKKQEIIQLQNVRIKSALTTESATSSMKQNPLISGKQTYTLKNGRNHRNRRKLVKSNPVGIVGQ